VLEIAGGNTWQGDAPATFATVLKSLPEAEDARVDRVVSFFDALGVLKVKIVALCGVVFVNVVSMWRGAAACYC